jgi:hypothetical protein
LEGGEVLTNTLVKRILIEESATETVKPKAVESRPRMGSSILDVRSLPPLGHTALLSY